MDPNSALEIARGAVARFRRAFDSAPADEQNLATVDEADTLVEAFDALDKWLSKNGHLPNGWLRKTGRAA